MGFEPRHPLVQLPGPCGSGPHENEGYTGPGGAGSGPAELPAPCGTGKVPPFLHMCKVPPFLHMCNGTRTDLLLGTCPHPTKEKASPEDRLLTSSQYTIPRALEKQPGVVAESPDLESPRPRCAPDHRAAGQPGLEEEVVTTHPKVGNKILNPVLPEPRVPTLSRPQFLGKVSHERLLSWWL